MENTNKFWKEFKNSWKGEESYIMVQYTSISKRDGSTLSGGFYRCNLTFKEGISEYKKSVENSANPIVSKIYFKDSKGEAVLKITNNI